MHKGHALTQFRPLVQRLLQFDWEKILVKHSENISETDVVGLWGQIIIYSNFYNESLCCDFSCVTLCKTLQPGSWKAPSAEDKS